jgi:hypothetical protein
VSAAAGYAFVGSAGRELLRAPLDSGLAGTRDGDALLCLPTPDNAARLRAALPALAPRSPGLASSFGFGDRLGLATPGHVAALRRRRAEIFPVLAQQSVRELDRTGRTFEEVMAAATFGALRTGWLDGYAADADHLKRPGDVAAAVAAGFVVFTLDPSDQLDLQADGLPKDALGQRWAALPWDALRDTPQGLLRRYRNPVELARRVLPAPTEEAVIRAAVKLGAAVALVAELAREVPGGCDVEISLDETPLPTTAFEHVLVATELRRLGVRWTSFAPRFPGAFEKGIDYHGSIDEFAEAARLHAEIADAFGPYKLSLHSGSDKLRLYPVLAEVTNGLLHVKTCGTSYLEGLRVAAATNPGLMRAIWALARTRYDHDRATYELTAEVAHAPGDLPDEDLPALLADDHARRILHVTFGSVLADPELGRGLHDTLTLDGGTGYAAALESHFDAHLAALS